MYRHFNIANTYACKNAIKISKPVSATMNVNGKIPVKKGIDTFDCVSPTRLARHGGALMRSESGKININNAQYKNEKNPIDPTCLCETCQNFSLSYLHHLFKTNELLGLQLLTFHNIFLISYIFEINN